MPLKIATGIIALLLMVAYLLPIALKLKEASLAVIIGAGIVMAAVDWWQSLRSAQG